MKWERERRGKVVSHGLSRIAIEKITFINKDFETRLNTLTRWNGVGGEKSLWKIGKLPHGE